MTDKAKPRGSEWVWNIPSLPPGAEVRVQVECECRQPAARACCRFSATPANGQAVDRPAYVEIAATSPFREGGTVARPPAVPSRLAIKVDNRNRIRAGENQQFEVDVSNEGERRPRMTLLSPRAAARLATRSTADFRLRQGVAVRNQRAGSALARWPNRREDPAEDLKELPHHRDHFASRPDHLGGRSRQPPAAAADPRQRNGSSVAMSHEL